MYILMKETRDSTSFVGYFGGLDGDGEVVGGLLENDCCCCGGGRALLGICMCGVNVYGTNFV